MGQNGHVCSRALQFRTDLGDTDWVTAGQRQQLSCARWPTGLSHGASPAAYEEHRVAPSHLGESAVSVRKAGESTGYLGAEGGPNCHQMHVETRAVYVGQGARHRFFEIKQETPIESTSDVS